MDISQAFIYYCPSPFYFEKEDILRKNLLLGALLTLISALAYAFLTALVKGTAWC